MNYAQNTEQVILVDEDLGKDMLAHIHNNLTVNDFIVQLAIICGILIIVLIVHKILSK